MPRQGRLDAPGTLHHVMIRGIDGLEIFRDDQDREDCRSRIPQLVGSIGQNIRLIPYGNYVHVHNKYLHLGHYQDYAEAGNREKKVTVFNNVPQKHFEVKTGYLVLVKILGERKAMDEIDIDLR